MLSSYIKKSVLSQFDWYSQIKCYKTNLTSTNPPRSRTNKYNLYKSSGCFDIVGHAAIGVRRSSMKARSLSTHPRLSGASSISYNLPSESDFWHRHIPSYTYALIIVHDSAEFLSSPKFLDRDFRNRFQKNHSLMSPW